MLSLPFTLLRQSRDQGPEGHGSHTPSLGFALKRPEVRFGILLVVLAGIGPRVSSSLLGPYLIDKGMDLGTLGILNGSAAVGAGVAGTFVGGLLVQGVGAGRATFVAIVLHASVLALLACLVHIQHTALAMLVGAQVALTISMAIGFVATYALLMGASSLRQAGVDFTLFQCADAATATLGGVAGGVVAHAMGYANVFSLAAACALLAALVSLNLIRRIDQSGELAP